MSFEEMANMANMANKTNIRIFEIKEGRIEAKGIYMPEALFSYNDTERLIISYPDTGVFVLFKGSYTECTAKKYRDYINHEKKTTREIVFQSRNAAARFVLGDRGRTDSWKLQNEF